MTDLLTPELVEKAGRALMNAVYPYFFEKGWELKWVADGEKFESEARAVLEAALPDIVEAAANFPNPDPDCVDGPTASSFEQGYVVGFWDAVARSRSSIRTLIPKAEAAPC